MIPEKGVIQVLIECRCCRRREILRLDVGRSWLETAQGIFARWTNGRMTEHSRLNSGGCENVAVFDLLAISQKHEEDPE